MALSPGKQPCRLPDALGAVSGNPPVVAARAAE